MLNITIPEVEYWDELRSIFVTTKSQKLQLEHSLVSISKWESTHNKPFLSNDEKTNEETVDYIRCMVITQNVNPDVYDNLPETVYKQITEYINAPMTATWFSKQPSQKSRDVITSEVIYYWMITQNIPMECQKWHLNRLLTLIRVCNIKNQPAKKMGRKEMLSRRKALNESRRARLNTKG